MKVERSDVQLVYDSIYQIVGQLAQYTVKWINKASLYIQNSPTAYSCIALIGANIVFFEVALTICRVANCLFNCFHAYKNLQRDGQRLLSFSLVGLFVSTLTGANWVFCKTFCLPIACWKATAISFTTQCVYLCCRSIPKRPPIKNDKT